MVEISRRPIQTQPCLTPVRQLLILVGLQPRTPWVPPLPPVTSEALPLTSRMRLRLPQTRQLPALTLLMLAVATVHPELPLPPMVIFKPTAHSLLMAPVP